MTYWAAPLLVFVATFLIYLITMDRGVDFADYGDFQVVPSILGIAYPTGYPGYTLIGWLWSHSVIIGTVAWRLNLLTVLAAAATNALLTLIIQTFGISYIISASAAIAYGLAYQTWTHANAPSPHELGTTLLVLSVYTALRGVTTCSERMLVVTAVVISLAIAVDNSTALALPGLMIILAHRRVGVRGVALAIFLGVAIIAAAYAYLPARSEFVTAHGLDPSRALGFAVGQAFWDQGHPATLPNFVRTVTGSDYGALGSVRSMFSYACLMRTWNDSTGQITTAFGSFAVPFALVALVLFVQNKGRVGAGLACIALTTALFLAAYRAESDVARYVPREFAVAVLAMAWLSERATKASSRQMLLSGRIVIALLFVSIVVAEGAASRRVSTDRRTRDARAFVAFIRNKVPPGALIVAPWKYAPALAYMAYVEVRSPQDVVVTSDDKSLGALKSMAGRLSRRALFIDGTTRVTTIQVPARTSSTAVGALRRRGQTLVIATHAKSVAAACDRTLWLGDGMVQRD